MQMCDIVSQREVTGSKVGLIMMRLGVVFSVGERSFSWCGP